MQSNLELTVTKNSILHHDQKTYSIILKRNMRVIATFYRDELTSLRDQIDDALAFMYNTDNEEDESTKNQSPFRSGL